MNPRPLAAITLVALALAGGLSWQVASNRANPGAASSTVSSPTPLAARPVARPAPAALARGTLSPEDACRDILALPEDHRLAAAAALLLEVADQPGLSDAIARRLCAADPANVRAHGFQLIAILVQGGAPAAAVRFAAAGGPEQPAWLDCALRLWAAHDPVAATAAALAEPDGAGFGAVVQTWAGHDPAALAGFAMEELHGPARMIALEQALSRWLERDPPALADWLAAQEPSPALDAARLQLAGWPALVRLGPELALEWAASVADADLRARSLSGVVRAWAGDAPDAARRHLLQAADLPAADRQRLLRVADRPPD